MKNEKKGGIIEIAVLATAILAVLKLLGIIGVSWGIVFLPMLMAAAGLAVLIILAWIWDRRDL